MRVALTGATGVLGGHVLRRLLTDGHSVRAMVRGDAPRDFPPAVEWVPGALPDATALDQLVDGTDAIVHCAYDETDAPEEFVQSNVLGTLRLLQRSGGRQFLFVSSLAVYGTEPSRLPLANRLPLDEEFPLWPTDFYGAHKSALEKMVIAAHTAMGINASVWRVGSVLAEYPDPTRDHLAQVFTPARASGVVERSIGAYVITAADTAGVLATALDDPTVAGQVINTFDRWLDFASLAPQFATLAGRAITVDCAKAPEPEPGLSNRRLVARRPTLAADAELTRLLSRLATE